MQIDGRTNERRATKPRSFTIAAGRGPTSRSTPFMDSLEPRLALSIAPLPHIADMESPNDTVVRLETNFGDIDIELYNSAAPITVANFLNYVNTGRFGESFFHRSAITPSPFVLQGGGFTYTDSGGLQKIATDSPIIREASGKSNVAQTIAMARTSDLNSATDQFFINYVDNSASLDPTSPTTGYTVFGKIIQGWSVVQTIEALSSIDLTNSPAFAGPDSSAFNEVPVTSDFDPNVGVRQSTLVNLIAAEVIKPASVAGFFAQQVVYPEGFRSGTSIETLTIVNPNSVSGSYQIIARYETGQRDTVIASGTLNANTSLSITLSDFNQPGLNTVRSGVPYALAVQSAFAETFTAAQPIAASMNRIDFGGDMGEAFLNPATVTAAGALQTWDLPFIERNDLSQEFVVFQNLSDTTTTVTTVFHSAGGDVTAVRVLEPYRRGGLEVFDLGITSGVLWAHVTADQNIAVAVSDYDLPAAGANPATADTPAWGTLGVTGDGSTIGGFAGAEIQNNFASTVSLVNPSGAAASVTLKFWRTSQATGAPPITKSLVLAPGARNDLLLDPTDLGIPAGETFTITYSSDTPIAVQYTSVGTTGRDQSTGTHSDGVSSVFAASLPSTSYFADGQMDPTRNDGSQTETLSIFNPFSNTAITFNYTVRFYFSDGTTIDGASGTLAANARLDLVTSSIAAVHAKAATNPAFRTYSIAVIGTGSGAPLANPVATSGFATLTRWDSVTGHAISSQGLAAGIGPAFTDPGIGV